jgi:hypothetical protein
LYALIVGDLSRDRDPDSPMRLFLVQRAKWSQSFPCSAGAIMLEICAFPARILGFWLFYWALPPQLD